MKDCIRVVVLGDSILKGVQLDSESGRYRIQNGIDAAALEGEFGLSIRNDSHFGATVEKGRRRLEHLLQRGVPCDVLVTDFGGNDCDVSWGDIAKDPAGEHLPRVPLEGFVQHYRSLLRRAKACGILPIVTTLPPLDSARFFRWWCRDIDRTAVRRWLGGLENIYAWQERYSRAVEGLAREEGIPLVDLRGAFLEAGHLERTLCDDGTHPNALGQGIITRAFQDFARRFHWERPQTA